MKLKTLGLKARDQELALERLTVLSAPNGSGKSTFAEAVRFLALGYVPALGKRPQDTAVLMRDRFMAAILTLSDGRVIGRSLEETEKGFHSRAECSWLDGHGVHRHSEEILRLFGRDEADVAEALDIRQLLNASPTQREARIAALLSAGHSAAAEKSERLRSHLPDRSAEGGALAAARARIDRLLRESDLAGALAWTGEERRRATALLLQKSKAREELEARLTAMPAADPEQVRRLEEERERLERELGALEEKALQMRLREERLERLRRAIDAARRARDEAVAERSRWETRARERATDPEELLNVERELDDLQAPVYREPGVAADAAARAAELRREAEAIVLPELPDLLAAERRLETADERAAAGESPWIEVAVLADSLRTLAGRNPGSPMVQVLVHAQRLSELARQRLREEAADLRRRREEQRERGKRLRDEAEERAAERVEAAARIESLGAEARAAEAEADRLRNDAQAAHARDLAGFDRRRRSLLQRRDALRRALQRFSEEDRRTAVARDQARLLLDSLEREWSALQGPGEPDGPPEADLHRRLHEVRRELAGLGAARVGRSELDRLRAEESQAREAREAHASLERALQRLQAEEIMESRERMVVVMESMLRAAGRLETPFFVAAGGTCRIGWRATDGKEVPVQSLSGGEWILFSACLAAVLVVLRNAPLRILLIEAGEADPHTLQSLLDALRSVADRLTCALVLTPRNVTAPGWTVVKRFGPPVAQNA